MGDGQSPAKGAHAAHAFISAAPHPRCGEYPLRETMAHVSSRLLFQDGPTYFICFYQLAAETPSLATRYTERRPQAQQAVIYGRPWEGGGARMVQRGGWRADVRMRFAALAFFISFLAQRARAK